jgi:hypothetical protein
MSKQFVLFSVVLFLWGKNTINIFFVLHEPVTISTYWLARQLEEQDIRNKCAKGH